MREWLRKKRKALNLTQDAMAKKMGTNVQYYNRIELGCRQVDLNLSIAAKLAKIFGITLDDVWANEQKWLKKQKREAKKVSKD